MHFVYQGIVPDRVKCLGYVEENELSAAVFVVFYDCKFSHMKQLMDARVPLSETELLWNENVVFIEVFE